MHKRHIMCGTNLVHEVGKPCARGRETSCTRWETSCTRKENLVHEEGEPRARGRRTSCTRKENLVHKEGEPRAQGRGTSCTRKENLVHKVGNLVHKEGEPRAQGGKPRAQGRKPRAQGRKPRAQGRKPRARWREPPRGVWRFCLRLSAFGASLPPLGGHRAGGSQFFLQDRQLLRDHVEEVGKCLASPALPTPRGGGTTGARRRDLDRGIARVGCTAATRVAR